MRTFYIGTYHKRTGLFTIQRAVAHTKWLAIINVWRALVGRTYATVNPEWFVMETDNEKEAYNAFHIWVKSKV